MGKVGASLLGQKTLSVFSSQESKEKRANDTWLKNADRIVQTLGELKGGVMKVGQMMSLQEGIFPPEFIQIISALQKQAPPVSFSELEPVLKENLPDYFTIFSHIDPEPYASASIGQVHKATLVDGRKVALKVQYPGIEQVIKSDLKNLKTLFSLMGTMFFKFDIEPVWDEVKNQTMKEIDYHEELKNQERFIELFKNDRSVIIPRPIREASGKNVLCTEFIEGEDLSKIADSGDIKRRNLVGEKMFTLFLKQFFQYKVVHADPNIANYAVTGNNDIIIYDFGQVKDVPEILSENYRVITGQLFKNDYTPVPELLFEIGLHYLDGSQLESEMVNKYVDLYAKLFTADSYCFSPEDNIISQLIEIGKSHFAESSEIVFPPEVVFINRAFAGMLSTLNRLKSCSNWGALLKKEASISG